MVDNALNPAWRDTTVHFLVKESWPGYTPADIVKEGKDAMEQSAYELRGIAPDSGAYINEVSNFASEEILECGLEQGILILHDSAAILKWIGRRPFTANTTPVSWPPSTNTILRVCSGVRCVLAARSGMSAKTADSVSSLGLKHLGYEE